MNRVPLAAASLVLALASAAVADEYTSADLADPFVVPPPLANPATMTPAQLAAASTQIIGPKTDGLTVTTTLPFEFPFFGTLYSTISVSDDGWIAFGTTSIVAGENAVLPAKVAPNAIVAALWDDLRTPKKGSVVRFTTGTGTNRTFVIAWQHMDTVAASTTADLSFEVLLHEGTGVVDIRYLAAGAAAGLSFTAGIENETGTRAIGALNLDNTNAARPASGRRFTPNAVTVSGRITRDRPVPFVPATASTGLSETETDLNVVGARVEIVREDAATRTVVGFALTDATGTFSATVRGIEGSPTLAVDVLASGDESRVTDVDGKTWTRRIATGFVPGGPSVGTVHLDATAIANDPNFMKALNVQQAAYRGYRWAVDAGSSHTPATREFPQLEIRWVQGAAVASGYAPATTSAAARATISDAPPNPDPYDDDIVLREYGQHVLATIAAFPSSSATHQWNVAVGSESVAFLDGFSFWFAAAVQGRDQFIDTKTAATSNVFELETQLPAVVVTPPATPPSGVLVPGAVAASLWDLVDDAAEARDAFAGALPDEGYEVLAALDQRKGEASLPSGASAWTISSFFDVWRAGGPVADRQATSRVFIHYATFPDDPFEPNDLAGEETPFNAATQKMSGLTLSRENSDRFSFPIGAVPLTVAVSYSEATEVTVTVLDGAGAEVASGSSGTVRSPVLVAVPVPAAPATYVAVVSWKSGPSALYTIGIANTPTLVTTSLPDWTAGVLFNQVLQVTGGLAPVTLSIRPSLPEGLTLVNPEGRLTGVPTSPGVYDLEVVATDASGAGPQTAGHVTLTVHDALTLRDVFGIAASKTVEADLGTGGTGPVWTPDSAPPSGLTLTGGATLHLSGAAGSPRAFDVQGHGTDSVGAVVPTAASHIVVCAHVGDARGTAAAAGARFGFWFDALEGTRATFEFSFTGGANAPSLSAVVDAAGTKLDFAPFVRRQGGHTKLTNFVVPKTARYFLIFKATSAAGSTVTSARANVRAPTGFTSVADIATTQTRIESRFQAVAGARVTVTMHRGRAPIAARPGTITLTDPTGDPVALPPHRRDNGGNRVTVPGITLPETGEYVLTVGGDGATTGPLVYEVKIVTPKNVVFSID